MCQTNLLGRVKFSLAVSAVCLFAAYRPVPARAQVPGRIAIPADDFAVDGDSVGDARIKGGIGLGLRSVGGQIAHRLQTAIHNGTVPVHGNPSVGQQGPDRGNRRGDVNNIQVNDPVLDHTVTFPGTRPFELSTQSETSVTADGPHIVVGYNSSAASVIESFTQGLFITQLLFSAYSVSHDGGLTWASGFVPPADPNSPFTFGDPSLALDRHGNVFYASLGTDALGNSALIVNKSSDHGSTFGAATVVAVDPGSDKDWLAIGPDPAVPQRDNLYMTWTSFQTDATGATVGSQLMLARSTDGGATWTSKALFTPVDDGINSSFLTFTNPVVDASSGRLYIPFLHISDINADNVRVLVSNDGGQTFQFLKFNQAGAPDVLAFPVVTPGAINDCGGGGFRNVLHQGASLGAGRIPGTFRYERTTRLITQPAAAAFRGRLLIALNRSTSPSFGDPASGSEIDVLYSQDGGANWAPPLRIAASTVTDPQHVHPAITLDQNGNEAWVAYYVQQANDQLRTDVAKLHVSGNHLTLDGASSLSTVAFDLTPNNLPTTTPSNPARTTNYDRIIATCYDIGEYMSLAATPGQPIAAWGDNRNTWTGPAGSAAPFTHAQPDVFSGRAH